MTRRLLLSYLSITAFVLLVLEVPLGVTLARAEHDRLETNLERDARVLATFVEDTLEGRADADVQGYAVDYAERSGARVVVVGSDGVSVADSDATGASISRDFSTRPEIASALAGAYSTGTRFSETLDEGLLYVAVPVASGGVVHGAVRITYPTADVDREVRNQWLALGALAAVVLIAVALVGYVLARSVTRPVRALARAADTLARGDLRVRAPAREGPPEIRVLAGEFNVMADRLEELVGAQRAFVADASHELRTPLTALRLRLENLALAAPADRQREVQAATDEVGRLSRLVETLLALARAEGARPERVALDVSEGTRERVDEWQALADERDVTLALEAPPGVRAFAARDALPRILDNLLANAMEVAPVGSTISVRTEQHDGFAELHVVDAGPGLDDEQRARAFDRFWRSPEAKPGRGSGLGLAIVAQLATASGGSAELRRGPSGGIDAVVRLPLAPAGSDSADPPPS